MLDDPFVLPEHCFRDPNHVEALDATHPLRESARTFKQAKAVPRGLWVEDCPESTWWSSSLEPNSVTTRGWDTSVKTA